MPDFEVELHLRALPGSDPARAGYLGAYAWFFGRFDTMETFQRELAAHIATELGYTVVEVIQANEIEGAHSLESEHVELYDRLDLYPIQYRDVHTYRIHDA